MEACTGIAPVRSRSRPWRRVGGKGRGNSGTLYAFRQRIKYVVPRNVEPLNRPAEVGFRRFEDQMVVVRHNAIAVYNDRILPGHAFQIQQELPAIPNIVNDRPLTMPPVEHVVEGAWVFNT